MKTAYTILQERYHGDYMVWSNSKDRQRGGEVKHKKKRHELA